MQRAKSIELNPNQWIFELKNYKTSELNRLQLVWNKKQKTY
jgi:hypothetical protein